MKQINRLLILTLFLVGIFAGCSVFRYAVIPQENPGPHGGSLVLIDKGSPEYIEFVATSGEPEWTFQIFSFDKLMRPQSISGPARAEITLPDGTVKDFNLWNTKPFIWSKGIGHLENRVKLEDVHEFSAKVTLRRGGTFKDYLDFKYPYNRDAA
jgi:hypothetical protein